MSDLIHFWVVVKKKKFLAKNDGGMYIVQYVQYKYTLFISGILRFVWN